MIISRRFYRRAVYYLATVWIAGSLAATVAAGLPFWLGVTISGSVGVGCLAGGGVSWLNLYVHDSASPWYWRSLHWLWWPYKKLIERVPHPYTGFVIRLALFISVMTTWLQWTTETYPLQLGLGYLGSESASALYVFLELAHQRQEEERQTYHEGVDYSSTVEVEPPTEQHTVLQVDELEELKLQVWQITDEAIADGRCICCGSNHPFLGYYPFDPVFHGDDCQVPVVRQLIDPGIAYCPRQEVIA